MPVPLAASLVGLEGDPRDELVRLSSMGYRHIQLSATRPGLRPRDLDRPARRGLRETLKQLELVASGVDLWIPPSHFLDDARVARAVDAVHGAIELGADLGGVAVSVLLPQTTGAGANASGASGSSDAGRTTAFDDTLAALARHADHHGVALVDFAIPPRGAACEPEGALRIGIDVAAWLAQGLDPALGVARHARSLAGVRLSDLSMSGMRMPLRATSLGGDGRLELLPLAAALDVIGFRTPVVADSRQWTDPWHGLAATLEAWRGLP